MQHSRHSSRRGRRKKRRTSVIKNVVNFCRTYAKEIVGILVLLMVLAGGFLIYKHWPTP